MQSEGDATMRGFRLLPAICSALSVIVLATADPSFGQQKSSHGWTPELAMKVKNVGAVRVSPDGRKVAYTVSQAVMTPERSEYVTQIWLANTDGSDPL